MPAALPDTCKETSYDGRAITGGPFLSYPIRSLADCAGTVYNDNIYCEKICTRKDTAYAAYTRYPPEKATAHGKRHHGPRAGLHPDPAGPASVPGPALFGPAKRPGHALARKRTGPVHPVHGQLPARQSRTPGAAETQRPERRLPHTGRSGHRHGHYTGRTDHVRHPRQQCHQPGRTGPE